MHQCIIQRKSASRPAAWVTELSQGQSLLPLLPLVLPLLLVVMLVLVLLLTESLNRRRRWTTLASHRASVLR
jgi:hypothetical protein